MSFVFSLLGIPIAISSILGNSLTILAVVKTRSLRIRHTFLPTTSLAFSDLFFSLLCCPVNYVTTLTGQKSLDATLCRINGFLGILFCQTSILTLSILSLDRYVCIVKPFQYELLITSRRIKTVLVVQWIFSGIIAAVPLSGWGNYIFYPQKGFCFIDYKKDIWAFVFIGVWMYVCFGFISFSYYKIFEAARVQKRRIRDQNHPKEENPTDPNTVHQLNLLRRIQKENKTAITIFVIISAYVFCWAPFCVVNFTAAVLDFNIPESADIACCLMVAVGSCVNPVIYGWLDGSFRAAFKKLLAPILQIRASRTAPTLRNAFHPRQDPYYIQMLYPSLSQRRERMEKFL